MALDITTAGPHPLHYSKPGMISHIAICAKFAKRCYGAVCMSRSLDCTKKPETCQEGLEAKNKVYLGWSYLTSGSCVMRLYTSSSRAGQGRKFHKKKELYIVDRICQ